MPFRIPGRRVGSDRRADRHAVDDPRPCIGRIAVRLLLVRPAVLIQHWACPSYQYYSWRATRKKNAAASGMRGDDGETTTREDGWKLDTTWCRGVIRRLMVSIQRMATVNRPVVYHQQIAADAAERRLSVFADCAA